MKITHFSHRLPFCLLPILVFPLAASTQTQSPKSLEAGRISALVPTDHVLRENQNLDATKDMVLMWRDVVQTESGGRVRIQLTDGSILSIGSDAQLRILQHDTKRQQTTLELLSGRLLADAVHIARHGGKFDVRTPVAVAGVVGTSFGLLAGPDSTDVLCRVGAVRVQNADPSVAGKVIVHAGEFTHVVRGMPPSPPAKATPDQFQAGKDATAIPGSMPQ